MVLFCRKNSLNFKQKNYKKSEIFENVFGLINFSIFQKKIKIYAFSEIIMNLKN